MLTSRDILFFLVTSVVASSHGSKNIILGSYLAKRHSEKTAILVHGCHLDADNWEHIIWGEVSSQRLGRVPHAILLAVKEDASLVVFGTGGSQRGGLKEGDFTLRYMRRNLPRMYTFDKFRNAGLDVPSLAVRMEEISVCETDSRNTVEELTQAFRLFARAAIRRVILVSSGTHLPRCLRDALVVMERLNFHPTLMASPCDTCYEGCGPGDVVVIEPGHRGDRDRLFDGELGMHRLTARAIKVPLPQFF